MSEHDDLIGDYLDEGRAYLDFLNDKFLTIEADPGQLDRDPEIINETFRAAHSLKGLTAAFGFDRSNVVVHRMENILDSVRHGEMKLSPGMIVVLYKSLDVLTQLTDEIAESGAEASDPSQVLQAIDAAMSGGKLESTEGLELPEAEKTTPIAQPASGAEGAATEEAGPARSGKKSNETIRVGMDRLDRLMNLTGELVIARSRILNLAETLRLMPDRDVDSGRGVVALDEFEKVAATMGDAISDLEGVTNGIQNTVMEVRMVSLEPIFKRFNRTVRDVANQLGKRIQLVLEGAETELDKRVADELVNPLTHLIRNAADHGLEMPAARKAASKPEVGTVTLRAYQGGNNVVIEVCDDGGGMDPEQLKAHAMNKGILHKEEAEKLTDEECCRLIFRPGFSTAAAITDISGRGMGMDIVLASIEEMKGSIDVESTLGEGSVFAIKLPLTLSILTCLLVRVNGEIFAIPLSDISELITVQPEELSVVMSSEVVMVRDRPVPLLDLREMFEFQTQVQAEDYYSDGGRRVVVIQAASGTLGVAVDELLRKEDLVVKPLDKGMAVDGISGSAILGDGRVALILDPGNMSAAQVAS